MHWWTGSVPDGPSPRGGDDGLSRLVSSVVASRPRGVPVLRSSRAAVCSAAALLLAAGAAPALAGPAQASQADSAGLRIEVLSNRADMLSGGDALVEVVL